MTDIPTLEAKLAEAVAAHDEAIRRQRETERALAEARSALTKALWGVAVGDVVNIEVDLLARYLERLQATKDWQ